MKTQGETLTNFYWQDGYAAFSISEKEVNRVRAYIKNQHSHHSKKNHREEIT
jgi:REP element-mobilizing transposase RayT